MSEYLRPPIVGFRYLEGKSGLHEAKESFSGGVHRKVMFAGGLWLEPFSAVSRNPILKALTVNNSIGALRSSWKSFPAGKRNSLAEKLRGEKICCLVADIFEAMPYLRGVFDEIRFSNMVQEFHYSSADAMREAVELARKSVKRGGHVVILDNQVRELDEIMQGLGARYVRNEIDARSNMARQTEYHDDFFPYVKYVI